MNKYCLYKLTTFFIVMIAFIKKNLQKRNFYFDGVNQHPKRVVFITLASGVNFNY